MQIADSEDRSNDRLPGNPGRVHYCAGVHPANRQWRPHWWSEWLAPVPNWLERLERGSPLPRTLRR